MIPEKTFKIIEESETTEPKLTIGEVYSPAMNADTEDEAMKYLSVLIKRKMKLLGINESAAKEMELHNIGYYAGYCDDETRKRVNRLYKTTHPVFGNWGL